jgi:hypothetical protein
MKNTGKKMIKGYAEGGTVETNLLDVYQSTLGRAPDEEGLRYWQGQLDSGATIESVTDSMNSSEEAGTYRAGLAEDAADQQQYVTDVTAGQKDLILKANTDPGSLVEQTGVATTTMTPDQLVSSAVGQVAAPQSVEASSVNNVSKADTIVASDASTMEAALSSAEAEGIIDSTEAAFGAPTADATVRGQLTKLMQDFEGGDTPVWASGAMRQAMGVMQARGMGASSIAGAAVVRSAMESAIGIASADAATTAQFEMQNLSNEQQTSLFKTQQRLSSLFTDQAAKNASLQFNATSENQTTQFFANLQSTASQFNAAQVNAIMQFNAGEANAAKQYNATLQAQSAQFNAENSLVISQANAQWRQTASTADTLAQNMSNLEYTKEINSVNQNALDQIWQRESDIMDYAFTADQNSQDRATSILLAKMSDEAQTSTLKLQQDMADDTARGTFIATIASGLLFG